MGLVDSLRGNASEADLQKVAEELEPLLAQTEEVHRAYAVFRDLFVFTNRRLILVDKQGMSGKKTEYHSIPYRSITQFKVETAGSFDADAELTIFVSGGAPPIHKEFGKKSNIMDIQAVLAHYVLS